LDIKLKLIGIIKTAIESAAGKLAIKHIPEIMLEAPRNRKLADLSTNIAMQICKAKKGLKPFEVAEDFLKFIKEGIEKAGFKEMIETVEVKPPGFINFHFSNNYLYDVIDQIISEGTCFGRSIQGKNKKVLIEFVSANPTGPLSIAHGRQAAIGDVLTNILEFAGYKVAREYYLNDEGNQIELLGRSIHARYCELLGEACLFPEAGYKGDYIYDIAKAVIEKHNKALTAPDDKNISFFSDFGIKYIMSGIRKDLSDFSVRFDNYYSQHKLGKSGKVEKVLTHLKEKGFLYEKDGALWFSSTRFGDDKDRVLRKSDGSYTYITPDIAYHEDKFKRGFNMLINLWGPDHHGYISRIKAACQAIGKDKGLLSVLIIQLVTLSRAGVPVRMSTREGEFITLRQVIDEVGKDVTRFFFLTRRRDSHLDFDLELAKKESMENPVYYIQYAHARICGILEHRNKEGKGRGKGKGKGLELLCSREELKILRILREFPEILEESARDLEPHRLISYLMELAAAFHVFYSKHRVVSDDANLTSARLVLIESLKIVFSKALVLLGVSCPEKM
jgi:arginyl-tRNA synthetase